MITDIWTVIWKEWRELLFQRGSQRATALSWLLSVLIFGVILPVQIGRSWVETSLTIVFWVWLPTLPVLALIADTFAGERERHTLETLLSTPLSEAAILFGKVSSVVGYGWLFTLLDLLTSLVVVNVVHSNGELLFYPASIVLGGMTLGFLTATLAASIGVIVSLRSPTVRQAAQQLAFVSLGLTWLPILCFSLLPIELQMSFLKSAKNANLAQLIFAITIFLAILDAGLLSLAIAQFKRSRLILD